MSHTSPEPVSKPNQCATACLSSSATSSKTLLGELAVAHDRLYQVVLKPVLEIARVLVGVCSLIVGVALAGPAASAPADNAEPSVTAGQKAFQSGARFPWYDRASDSLRPLKLPPPRQPARWSFGGAFLRPLVWGMLAVALVAIVALAIYAARKYRGTTKRAAGGPDEKLPGRAASEALPFLEGRSRGDLLGEARRLYQQGNYSEAIIYLFSHELVELDRFAIVRLAQGKTNRQYLREAAQVPSLTKPLELTMTAFEDVFFGRRVLDRSGFEACYSQLPEFERLAARAAP